MKVSIIIPVYNTERYLSACIESCLSQSYDNIEIILIDDGSTDSSQKVLLEYEGRDRRVRVITKKNEGVAIARQDALKAASGEWVFFLDSDDCLLPDTVEVLVKNTGKADLSVGTYWEKEETDKYKRYHELPVQGTVTPQEYLAHILSRRVRWALWGILIKKSLFEEVTMPAFRVGEDASVLVQLICRSQNIHFVQKPVYIYLQRSTSAIHTRNAQNLVDILRFRMWIRDYLVKIGFDIPQQQIADFVADGFSESLLLGGYRYMPQEYKNDLHHLDICRLTLWQKSLVRTYSVSPLLGNTLRSLIWKMKKGLGFFKRTFSTHPQN